MICIWCNQDKSTVICGHCVAEVINYGKGVIKDCSDEINTCSNQLGSIAQANDNMSNHAEQQNENEKNADDQSFQEEASDNADKYSHTSEAYCTLKSNLLDMTDMILRELRNIYNMKIINNQYLQLIALQIPLRSTLSALPDDHQDAFHAYCLKMMIKVGMIKGVSMEWMCKYPESLIIYHPVINKYMGISSTDNVNERVYGQCLLNYGMALLGGLKEPGCGAQSLWLMCTSPVFPDHPPCLRQFTDSYYKWYNEMNNESLIPYKSCH